MIKKLDLVKKVKGGILHQISRTDKIALYIKYIYTPTGDKIVTGYEVIKIKTIDNRPYYEFLNRHLTTASQYDLALIPKKTEIYPRDEDFGAIGWFYKTEKQALTKYNKLIEEDIK